MKPFKNLTEEEYKTLLKFPAYISLLAADRDGEFDDLEKESAIKFAHIKTYSCNALLIDFYKEVDQVFEINIVQLDKELPKGKISRDSAIIKELQKLESIVAKSSEEYASAMRDSMRSFKNHVSKVHNNVLVDFVFPLPIKGFR